MLPLGGDSTNDGKHVVCKHSGGVASVSGPLRASDGGLGAGCTVSAVDAGGALTSCRERSGEAAAALGEARAAGTNKTPSAERENQPKEGSTAAVEHQQVQGPSNLVEGVFAQGHDPPHIQSQQPNRPLVASSASPRAESSRDEAVEAAAATPFDGSSNTDLPSREQSDVFSVRSMPSSVGEEREDEGMGGGTDAEPVLSGEESTSKRHRDGKSGGRSGKRKSHKHKHKRSHRHREKSSDEGGGKSRRRRSRDHGLLGSTGASTITVLAPLKRIPPPSSSSAQRAISQGDGPVGEAASGGEGGDGGGDDNGGGGG